MIKPFKVVIQPVDNGFLVTLSYQPELVRSVSEHGIIDYGVRTNADEVLTFKDIYEANDHIAEAFND